MRRRNKIPSSRRGIKIRLILRKLSLQLLLGQRHQLLAMEEKRADLLDGNIK